MDKIGLEGVGSERRKGPESAAKISRMGICAEVGWSIWREQVTWLAERILLRISMEDVLPRLARIHHKGVQLSLLHQPNCYSSPQNARNTRKLLLRETPTDGTDLHRCLGAFKGVHLSPLGFAACQSKKCTNRAKSIFSHRFHSAQMLGCAEFNHGLNGYDGA